MGGFLREGEWKQASEWEKSDDASFKRQRSSFRKEVEDRPDAEHPAATGRYHLYVSHACPWAHRTMIVRALMGLEDVISVSVVHPFMGDDGWTFDEDDPKVVPDPIHGASYLREVYLASKPDYTGRVTVPVLWDREKGVIVNNESREIIRMMSRAFKRFAKHEVDLCPVELEEEIDAAMDAIYESINNGVYKCGFAGSQAAYERAYGELFEQLDHWDGVLGKQRYMCGERLTEADVCMFTTLLRFDPVYQVHFKCNGQKIAEYEHLSGFLREVYQMPGVAQVCHMDHIKQHYYMSHEQLNPRRIVPVGPRQDLERAHGRDYLKAVKAWAG